MKLRVSQGEKTPTEVDLQKGEYLIGCGALSDLRIESPMLGPLHARLYAGSEVVEVEDLGCGLGTWMDGEEFEGRRAFPPGSRLQLGDVSLELLEENGEFIPVVGRTWADRYEVGEMVAQGAMGVVRLAHEPLAQREVALKQMHPELERQDARLAARFVEEAKITAHLEHPGIVPVHEVDAGEFGARFYTMKLVRGNSLEQVLGALAARKPQAVASYPLSQLLEILQKICDAVAFAHAKGIVHRDLKPSNIMLGEFGEVLVMDWGLAKIIDERMPAFAERRGEADAEAGSALTLAGAVMGTPLYMAPEQADGHSAFVDERSDVYALGGILYRMLTLQTPVSGRTVREILAKVSEGKIIPPAELPNAQLMHHLPGKRVPASLSAVAMKALAFSPERRYQGVTDLQADLRAFQSGFPTQAEGAGTGRQMALFAQRHHQALSTVAAALVLLLLLSGLYLNRISAESERWQVERDRKIAARKATEEDRHVAGDALVRLKKSIPEVMAEARKLIAEGNVAEALERMGFVISLDDDPEFRLARADLLQANERFDEAIAEYERVLAVRPDSRVKQNLELARRLRQENGGAPFLRPDLRRQLIAALTSQGRLSQFVPQGPPARYSPEEAALYRRLGAYVSQAGWRDDRIGRADGGGLRLDLNGLRIGPLGSLRNAGISDLSIAGNGLTSLNDVAGFSLRVLNIGGNPINDLSPLKGMPLERLDASNIPATDLRPLQGMALRRLFLWSGRYADFGPLAGMPLVELIADRCPVTSIAPLSGMPLQRLHLYDVNGVQDFRPLATLQNLESLMLPRHATQLGHLKNLRKLREVHDARFAPGWLPAAEFIKMSDASDAAWAQWSPTIANTGAVGLPAHRLTVDARGIIELDLHDSGIKTLAPLAPLPPFRLIINQSAALDFVPLQRSMLIDLNVAEAKISTVLPLFGCAKLESVTINPTASDVYLLRKHPSLKFLGYNSDTLLRRPKSAITEFFSPAPPGSQEGRLKPGNALAMQCFDEPQSFAAGWSGVNSRGEPSTIAWTSDLPSESGRGGGCLTFLEFRADNASGYFNAAPAFLGDKSAAYGGSLVFRLRQAHGRQPGAFDIILRSGTTRLYFGLPHSPGKTWETFTVPLQEAAGWKFGNRTGRPVSAGELKQVLGKLEQMLIPAEFSTAEREKSDLDEITLTTAAQDKVEAARLAELTMLAESAKEPWEAGRAEEALEIYRKLFAKTRNEVVLALSHAIFARSRWQTAWFKSTADPLRELDAWRALSRSPEATHVDLPAIAFDFTNTSPGRMGLSGELSAHDPGRDHFGMIARARLSLPAGTWRTTVRSDDGFRLMIDGNVVSENWSGHYAETSVGTFTRQNGGEVEVVLEYFQDVGAAELAFSLEPVLPELQTAPVASLQ